jgi:hypothetical protein
MSMSNLAYARCAYKSFSRSARHILQLIAGHQSLQTGWAYLSYLCLSDESGLTRRHVNFYRILREEDGLPVPHRSSKKVKFPTPPEPEKVKSESSNGLESLTKAVDKVVENKERKKKEAPAAPVSLSPQDGGDTPEQMDVTPEQLLRLGLTPGSHFWRQALGEEESQSPA